MPKFAGLYLPCMLYVYSQYNFILNFISLWVLLETRYRFHRLIKYSLRRGGGVVGDVVGEGDELSCATLLVVVEAPEHTPTNMPNTHTQSKHTHARTYSCTYKHQHTNTHIPAYRYFQTLTRRKWMHTSHFCSAKQYSRCLTSSLTPRSSNPQNITQSSSLTKYFRP